MEDVLVVIRLSRRAYGSQAEREDDVSSPPMVLIDGFRLLDASEDPRSEELQGADDGLQQNEDVSGEAENSMRRFEMLSVAGDFGDLDHDESCDEASYGQVLQPRMDPCALSLLLFRMRWLEYQYALSKYEESSRVQQLDDISSMDLPRPVGGYSQDAVKRT